MQEKKAIQIDDRTKRIAVCAVTILLGVGLSLWGGRFSKTHDLFILMDGMGILFVAALCGPYPGVISVFITFIIRIFSDGQNAYVMFLYMIAALNVAWAAHAGWFKKLWKTVLLGVMLSLLTGVANVFIIRLTVGTAFDSGMSDALWRGFKQELGECMFFALSTYLIYRFLPDRYKVIFPNGIFYTEDQTAAKFFRNRLRFQAKLSRKIAILTITEAVILTIFAAYFANLLIGSINFDMVPARENRAGQEVPPGKPADEQRYEEMIREAMREGQEKAEEVQKIIEESSVPEEVKQNLLERLDQVSANAPLFNDIKDIRRAFDNDNLDRKTALAFDIRLIMLLATFCVPITMIANSFAQSRIALPIVKMSRAMGNFVAYSDEEKRYEGKRTIERLNIKTKDEIEDLYHALVTTVRNIDSYLNRLREEEELENNLKVAQAASDAKTAFLSSMSHEIRTPINAVLGFDEMILMENKDPEIERYAEDIQSAGKTLLGLINDILDFSKIEAGKMDIIPVEYEISSTINDLVSMASSLAQDKGLYFDVNADSRMPHILIGDEIRLKQIILNILTNAVKYTEKGGVTFNIDFEKIDEESIYLIVHVKDTGIGIKAEDMDRLFSPFERLDEVNEAKNRAVKGTGLGMSITKQLLSRMDSSLEVDSVYGEGSDFHFRVVQKVAKWEELGNLAEAFKKYLPHEADKHKNDNFFAPEARILVTDDTEFNLLVVQRLLRRTKIRIDTASGGKETLDLICRNRYDIVYIDHMMPEMDGIATLKAMRGLPGNLNEDIPWIVLTANAVSGARETYLSAGFTDYMTKPVDYLSLKNSLIKYLPENKIEIREPEEGSGEADPEELSAGETEETLRKALEHTEGIDPEEALKNSGGGDLLLEIIKGYAAAIGDKAKLIEDYGADGDYKNYTIQVHALKSSSRLIGAMELSAMAAAMEEAGNRAQGEEGREAAIEEIREKTPELLSMYRGFREKLAPITAPQVTEEEKPELSEAQLLEILAGIREFAEAFDFDDVDAAMTHIEKHTVPEAYREKLGKLKTMVTNVDRDGILELLEEQNG